MELLVNSEKGELVFTNINVNRLPLGPLLAEEFQAPVLRQNSEDVAAHEDRALSQHCFV